MINIDPIGTVRSCFGGKFGVPRQPGLCPSAWGRLVFHDGYRSPEAVRGIESFSHLWLIFGFHETAGQGWKPTVRPPRLGGNQRVGVFASRSTFRPNGLGLSLVRLDGIESSGHDAPALLLGALDLIDGTPVYDIKPYLPYAEALPDAAGGFARGAIPRFRVELADGATDNFSNLPEKSRAVILDALSFDPRPAAGSAEPGRIYGAAMCGCNVRFTIGDEICTVLEIIPAEGCGLNG